MNINCEIYYILKQLNFNEISIVSIFWHGVQKYVDFTYGNKLIFWMRYDKFEGSYKSWYPDGTLMEECYYKNGELDGPYKKYGQIIGECFYKNGKMNGSYKYFGN